MDGIALDTIDIRNEGMGILVSGKCHDGHTWSVKISPCKNMDENSFSAHRNGVVVSSGVWSSNQMVWKYVSRRFFQETKVVDDLLGAAFGYVSGSRPTRSRVGRWDSDTDGLSYLKNQSPGGHWCIRDDTTVWWWMGEEPHRDTQTALDSWFSLVFSSCPKADTIADKMLKTPVTATNMDTLEIATRWRVDHGFEALWYGKVGQLGLSKAIHDLKLQAPGAYFRVEPSQEGPEIEIKGAEAHRIVGNVTPEDLGKILWWSYGDHKILWVRINPHWGVLNRGEA